MVSNGREGGGGGWEAGYTPTKRGGAEGMGKGATQKM